jgi:prephenate dehydrogenase
MDVGVIGLGLVGGSIALNLSQDFAITGYDVDIGVRGEALARGAIAHAAGSLADFCTVKLIFIATPPAAVVPTLVGLADTLRDDAVVTDCAGAKWSIVEAAVATRWPVGSADGWLKRAVLCLNMPLGYLRQAK